MPLLILLADDVDGFRRFVRQKLHPSGFSIIEAVDGLEAVQKAEECRPNLIVLDIGLPKLNGLEAARRIRRLRPVTKIVFLSQESSDDVVMEALRLGADGYVYKRHAETDLLPAIAAVLRGTRFVSKSVERSDKADRIEEDDKQQYKRIADSAVVIMHSEFASMQRLDSRNGTPGELVLLSFRGFTPEAAKFWQRVSADSGSTCAAALRMGKRVIVPDIEICEFMVGTEDLLTYRQTGIRAVQTTPLLSTTGQLVGMISTHWRTVHAPKEDDLQMLDALAKRTAALFERRRPDDV